jgi:hypothetical protein
VALQNKMFAMSQYIYQKGSHTDSPHLLIAPPKSNYPCIKLISVEALSFSILFMAASMHSAHALEKPLKALPLLDDAVIKSITNSEILAPVLKEIENSSQQALKFTNINGDNLDIEVKQQIKPHKAGNNKLFFIPLNQDQIYLINSNIFTTPKTEATPTLKPLQFIPLSEAESKPKSTDKQPLQAFAGNLTIGRPEDFILVTEKKDQQITDILSEQEDEDEITDLVDLGAGTDEEYPLQDLLSNVDGITLSIKSATYHNDNFFTTQDSTTTYLYEVITPAIALEGDNETYKFSSGISSEIGLFERDTADNYIDYNLDVMVSTRLNDQVAVTLTSSAKWDHDDRGSNDDVEDYDSPNRYFKPYAELEFNFGTEGGIVGLTMAGNITNTTYHNHRSSTQDLEKEVIGLDVDVTVARGPELSILTGIEFQFNNYEHLTSKTSQDLYYFIGADWNPSDLFNFDGKIGS